MLDIYSKLNDMKRVAILGSTGSIGQNTLKVIAALNKEPVDSRGKTGGFRVVALSANSNSDILLRQAKQFNPKWICLVQEASAKRAAAKVSSRCRVLSKEEGLRDLIRHSNADIVVLAISGANALMPLIECIKMKKRIILANKEAMVIAGPMIMKLAKKHKVEILPVDSEQSAIWQCLDGKEKKQLRKVYLTASGGPFKNHNPRQLRRISIRNVLKHPRWNMGRRISVDSATLMNKGLEIIEAMCLFGLDLSQIEIVIHPEAVIHSMVEFIDGVILAQIAITDMRIPIQYALTYPRRRPNKIRHLDFFKLRKMNFEKPNFKVFPCLGLAIEAAEKGATMPCVLNAADEIAVEAFLNRRINFTDIPGIIEQVMRRHKVITRPSLQDILDTDKWARKEAKILINY